MIQQWLAKWKTHFVRQFAHAAKCERLPNEAVGQYGERLATEFVRRKRYRIISCNERNLVGELDIIAVDQCGPKRVIVFIEVKTWTHAENGSGPSDAVDERKQKQITNAALFFLRSNRLLNQSCRFDVIEITLIDGSEPKIRHFENAFGAIGDFQFHC